MYQLHWKKCPLCRFFFLNKCPFLTITNTYSTGLAVILRFRAKSEGLGDFSLLNNETTRMLTSWPGSWESSGLLPELLTAAGPLLLLVQARYCCCCSDLQSTTPLDEHYTCIVLLKLSESCFMLLRTDYCGNYASILDAFLIMEVSMTGNDTIIATSCMWKCIFVSLVPSLSLLRYILSCAWRQG